MNRMMRDAGAGNGCCAFGWEKFSAAMKARSVQTRDIVCEQIASDTVRQGIRGWQFKRLAIRQLFYQ